MTFINPSTAWAFPTTPYISTSEFVKAPTSVDTSALVTAGSLLEQSAQLAILIGQASSWADQITSMPLAALSTTDTAQNLYVRRDGTVRVKCKFWPILELTDCQVGRAPSQLAEITDFGDVWTQGRSVLVIPVTGVSPTVPVTQFGPGPVGVSDRVYVKYTYVNGWWTTTLAQNATQGANTITVNGVLGCTPGSTATIYDANQGQFETIQVKSVAGNVVTLVNNLQYAHTVPTAPDSIVVAAIPAAAHRAVIALTTCLIKNRGAQAIIMGSLRQPTEKSNVDSGAMDSYEEAVDELEELRRVA